MCTHSGDLGLGKSYEENSIEIKKNSKLCHTNKHKRNDKLNCAQIKSKLKITNKNYIVLKTLNRIKMTKK